MLRIGVATRAFALKIVSKAAERRKSLAAVEKFVKRGRFARIEMR
jgi:hypothetical protein